MKANSNQEVLLEKICIWLKEKAPKYKYAFIASLVFGLLAYTFVFTNKLINHDEVIGMFVKGAGLTSGRWALDWMHYIFPDFSMPWIYGILSIVFIAIANCIIINMFEIKNKLVQILLSGLVVVFPSLIGTFSYMFASTSYTLSFLLSIVSAILLVRKNWVGKIVAVLLLAFSIGIYQSYIAVTASFLVLFLLKSALYDDKKISELIKNAIIYLIGLIAVL